MKFRSFYTVRFLLPLLNDNEEKIKEIISNNNNKAIVAIIQNLINRNPGVWTTVNIYASKENNMSIRIRNINSKHIYQVENFQSVKLSEGSVKRYVTYNRLPGYIVVRSFSMDLLFHILVGENIFYKNWQNKIKIIKKEDIVQIISWELDKIKVFMNFQKNSKQENSDFAVGDSVMIISGPLSNVVLTINEVYPDLKKAKMLATFFGRYTPIEASFDKLKKVNKS